MANSQTKRGSLWTRLLGKFSVSEMETFLKIDSSGNCVKRSKQPTAPVKPFRPPNGDGGCKPINDGGWAAGVF